MELLIAIGAIAALGVLAHFFGQDGADAHRYARTRWLV
jgi:hypothetical protein